jgi:protein translocase SecG subunit
MEFVLNIIQIVISILLITVILVQQKGTTLGGAFGGDSTTFTSKRGAEKFLHIATIVLAIIFIGLAIVNVIL